MGPRESPALQRLFYRGLKILVATETCVNNFPSTIDNDDVRCGRRVVSIGRVALRVEDYQMLQLVPRGVGFHARGRLIHTDGNTNELHPRAVFLLGREKRRLEMPAVAAPRRPELEEYRRLPDVGADIHRLSIECADD